MRGPPRFPPDVAAALQQPSGRVSVRYTRPERMSPWPESDRAKSNLRFIRTGSKTEGARVACVSVDSLLDAKHWDITLEWNAEALAISARRLVA